MQLSIDQYLQVGCHYAPCCRTVAPVCRCMGARIDVSSFSLVPNFTLVSVQVHWLRVILDEGHKVGGAALTNKLAMAANLRAERRWVVTGTPAPGAGAAELARLHPLLTFLRHRPYGGAAGKRLWDVSICCSHARPPPLWLR